MKMRKYENVKVGTEQINNNPLVIEFLF